MPGDVTLDDSAFPILIATVHEPTPEFVIEYKTWLLDNLARAETEDQTVVVFDDAYTMDIPPPATRRVMMTETVEMLNQPRHYGSVILHPNVALQLFVNGLAWMLGSFYRVSFAHNYQIGFHKLHKMALKAGINNPTIPDHATYVRPPDF